MPKSDDQPTFISYLLDKHLPSFIKLCHEVEEIAHDFASVASYGYVQHGGRDVEDLDELTERMHDACRTLQRRTIKFVKQLYQEKMAGERAVPQTQSGPERRGDGETMLRTFWFGLRAVEHVTSIRATTCDLSVLVEAAKELRERAYKWEQEAAAIEEEVNDVWCVGWGICGQLEGHTVFASE